MLASVGKDFVPSPRLMEYIHYNWIHKEETLFTACAYMITDQEEHQIIAFHPGAFGESQKLKVRDVLVRDVIWSFSYAIISPLPPDAALLQLQECKELGIKTFFDPGQNLGIYDQAQLRQAIDAASYYISNEYEFTQMMNISGYTQTDLLEHLEKIIVTLGKD
jgi:adenosine kinase